MKYDLIIFDWDGTLSDSIGRICQCMSAAFREVGLSIPDDAAIRSIIGLGLDEAVAILLPSITPDQAAQLHMTYRRMYRDEHKTVKFGPLTLFSGVKEGLLLLKDSGCILTVATGKGRPGLDKALAVEQWQTFFADTRCGGESEPKPSPKMVHQILETTGVSAARAVVVGDSVHDLGMAHAAGVDAVAVTYGSGEVQDLLKMKPKYCVDSFQAVIELLQ